MDDLRDARVAVDAGDDGSIIYNLALIHLARHCGFQPKACKLIERRPR